jgi:hypothetical protein
MPNDTQLNYYNKSKYYLLLCELHNPYIHGYSKIYSDPKIYTHYIVIERFDGPSKMSIFDLNDELDYHTDNEYDSDSSTIGVDDIFRPKNIYENAKLFKKKYNRLSLHLKHPTIRNYKNIISKPNYIKPEIAEYIILPTQESIAILKTFWIRIIQRVWKKIYSQRKDILKKRCCPGAISTFQLTGKWPEHCRVLPGLKGMLEFL